MYRTFLLLFCLLLCQSTLASSQPNKVSNLKVSTLSTMLASRGHGEWGYSALVEADNNKILFDTGRYADTVLKNARELNIDLSDVKDVVLSHNHLDHTGGLLTLRQALQKQNKDAITRIHVSEGIFIQRGSNKRMQTLKTKMEALGAEFIIYDKQHELYPGVWITGPIKRKHDNEKNWPQGRKIKTSHGHVDDDIPESQSLALHTNKGFVLVSGCGHAGIINTMAHITSNINNTSVFAAIGGFHLVSASDEHLSWTANKMEQFGVKKIIGAHCTGINSLYSLKSQLKLERSDAVVGAVGDSFDLDNGISPGFIAH